MMHNLRVFISSPNDVRPERIKAEHIISEIGEAYSDKFSIELLMWEQMALDAKESFQNNINHYLGQKPIDIAIFIVWRRIGTALGDGYLKDDGTPYTGTEYEYEIMSQSATISGKPLILFYRKNKEFQVNDANLIEAAQQKQALDKFLREKGFIQKTGSKASLIFSNTEEFAKSLKTHLINAIETIVGENIQEKSWEGNPYKGLRPFGIEDRRIYFGRDSIREDVSRAIIDNQQNYKEKCTFLIGESGSGKTSLVCAGVIPDIIERLQVEIPGISFKRVTPSELKTNLCDGFRNLVDSDENTLVFIDQFEELFTDVVASEVDRQEVLKIISNTTNKWRMIISIRNDYYTMFSRYPVFGELKNSGVAFDVPLMSDRQLTEIIDEPAKLAGAHWDIKDGLPLNKRLHNEAKYLRNLPLIEFALSELFDRRGEKNLLTYESYESIGGIVGAVTSYADGVFDGFNKKEKRAFYDIIGRLVNIQNSNGEYVISRRVVRQDELCLSDTHKLVISALIKAHLLVGDKDIEGLPVVTIVHEELLRSWRVVVDWIKENKNVLEQRDSIESRAQRWNQSGVQLSNQKRKRDTRDHRFLLKGTVFDAEFFLRKHESLCTPLSKEYIKKSILHTNRLKDGLAYVLLTVLVMFSWIMIFTSFDPWEGWLYFGAGVLLFGLSSSDFFYRVKGSESLLFDWLRVIGWGLFLGLSLILAIKNASDIDLLLLSLLAAWGSLFFVVQSLFNLIKQKRWAKEESESGLRGFFRKYETANRYANFFIWPALFGIIILWLSTSDLEQAKAYRSQANGLYKAFFELIDQQRTLRDDESLWLSSLYVDFVQNDDNYMNEVNLPDTITENAYNYARALYNIGLPYNSATFVNLGFESFNLLATFNLRLKCAMDLGEDKIAEHILEQFSSAGFDSIGDKTMDFSSRVWASEIIGRFDLALRIFQHVDLQSDENMYVNRAHASLFQKNIEEALCYYDSATLFLSKYDAILGPNRIDIKELIKNDYEVFAWNGINLYGCDQVCDRYGLALEPLYSNTMDTIVPDWLENHWVNKDFTTGFETYLRFFKNQSENDKPTLRCSVFDDEDDLSAVEIAQIHVKPIDGDRYCIETYTYQKNCLTRLLLTRLSNGISLQLLYNSNEDANSIFSRFEEKKIFQLDD